MYPVYTCASYRFAGNAADYLKPNMQKKLLSCYGLASLTGGSEHTVCSGVVGGKVTFIGCTQLLDCCSWAKKNNCVIARAQLSTCIETSPEVSAAAHRSSSEGITPCIDGSPSFCDEFEAGVV